MTSKLGTRDKLVNDGIIGSIDVQDIHCTVHIKFTGHRMTNGSEKVYGSLNAEICEDNIPNTKYFIHLF